MSKSVAWVWWSAVGLVALAVLLSASALLLNRVPLWVPPGPMTRLAVYLGRNQVHTGDDPAFPELRTPVSPLSPDETLVRVAEAMDRLGWKEIHTNGPAVQGVAVTPLLGFCDDVTAVVEPDGAGGSRLTLRSASRIGRADFGANLRHVLDLMDALDLDRGVSR
jgi:hypothetical protein